jgi:hypothetical protein
MVARWDADPDALDDDGRSPLHWFVLLIISAGAYTCIWLSKISTASLYLFLYNLLSCRAAYQDFPDAIRLLLCLYADKAQQDREGMF